MQNEFLATSIRTYRGQLSTYPCMSCRDPVHDKRGIIAANQDFQPDGQSTDLNVRSPGRVNFDGKHVVVSLPVRPLQSLEGLFLVALPSVKLSHHKRARTITAQMFLVVQQGLQEALPTGDLVGRPIEYRRNHSGAITCRAGTNDFVETALALPKWWRDGRMGRGRRPSGFENRSFVGN